MRTKNSLKNMIIALISYFITLLITFISQKYLINILGIEYSGINSVFNNILSMLSISELGIGTAIIFNLYEPIAKNKVSEIKSLLKFYKKAYNFIALFILFIGIILIPFIPNFISGNNISENIYLVFLLFLIDSVISYLATYKRSLIYANQKNRIIDIIHLCYTLILNISQILILVNTKNYILFLSLKIVCRLIENIVINIIANKMYPFIKDKNVLVISKDIKDDIFKRVKAQVLHSIGGFVVLGTDSLLVSKFFGLNMAGIYGVYIMVINAAHTIISQIFSAVTASIGNLLTEKDYKKNLIVYKRLEFINFIIYSVVSIVFYFSINDFICIWLDSSEYLFTNAIVMCLAINIFLQGMRKTMQTFATAAGICYENRFVPIFEATINLVASLILLKIFGIIGVVIGTILSTFVLYFYSFPKFIYNPLFKKDKKDNIIEFMKYVSVLIIMFLIVYGINIFVLFENIYLKFIIETVLNTFICGLLIIIIFHKTDEFRFIINSIKEKLKIK